MKDLEKDFVGRFKDREEPEGDFGTEDLWRSIASELEEDSDDPVGFANWKGWLTGLLLVVLAGAAWWALSIYPENVQLTEAIQIETTADPDQVPGAEKNKPVTVTGTANDELPTEENFRGQKSADSTVPETTKPTSRPDRTEGTVKVDPGTLAKRSNEDTSPAEYEEGKTNQAAGSGSETGRESLISENLETAEGGSEGTPDSPENSKANVGTGTETDTETETNDSGSNDPTSTSPEVNTRTDRGVALSVAPDAQTDLEVNTVALLTPGDLYFLVVPEPVLPTPEVTPPAPEEAEETLAIRKQSPLRWEIGLLAGGNQTLANHTVTDNAEYQNLRNISEGGAAGAKFGFELGVRRKNLSLSTGLSYEDLWRKFNYETLADNAVLLNNVLLRVVYDPVTETTIARTFGDTLLEGQTPRRVQHFNNYRLWSVPVSLGYHRMTPRWVFGVRAGVVLQFAGRQRGRFAAADGSVADFGPDDEATLFQPFSIGLRINPELGYRITDRLTLSLTPDLTWSRQKPTGNQTVGVSRYGGNVGLRWVIR